MPNFKQDNADEDVLKKIKRSFFIEWRIADKHKMDIFENIDYFLDSNQEGNPKIVTGNALRSALKKTTQRPFRLVPYFDPGVWGGQWMKKNCDLDEKQNNYAWSFDGDSLYFRFGRYTYRNSGDGFGFVTTSRVVRNEKLLSLWC